VSCYPGHEGRHDWRRYDAHLRRRRRLNPYTVRGLDLAEVGLEGFHLVLAELEANTVPPKYWQKVLIGRMERGEALPTGSVRAALETNGLPK
jgi:hypothetical protein